MKNEVIHIQDILDYCDYPIIFTACDSSGNSFLCLFCCDNPMPSYSAIRISRSRLENFEMGLVDLRSLFLNPENPAEYFNVYIVDGEIKKDIDSFHHLDSHRLPEVGYYMQ